MIDSFDDFVKRQNKIAEYEEESMDWEKELEEWLEHLNRLMKKIKKFLKDYIEQNRVTLEYRNKKVTENNIGTYDVKIVSILIGNAKVDIEPIGRNVIGAKGRVDIKGSMGKVRIVLVPKLAQRPRVVMLDLSQKRHNEVDFEIGKPHWTWKLSTPSRATYTELNEESFKTALMEVVNG